MLSCMAWDMQYGPLLAQELKSRQVFHGLKRPGNSRIVRAQNGALEYASELVDATDMVAMMVGH